MPSTPPALLILGPVIGAIIALAGTVITNFFAERRHARESIERQRDKAETKRTEQERVDIDRQLTALDYVEHLESYALQCANVVTFNAGFDHDHQEMKSLKALPAWPERIDWRLLGVERAAWARNLLAQTQLVRLNLSEMWQHNGPSEQADDEATEAARIGIVAWEEAAAARKAHGLSPIQHLPGSWDYAETLARAVKQQEERAASREASAEF